MSKKLLQAAAGAGGEALYVEDVFSTYLYTGTGSTQTITNGIDLDGEGGLVWIKSRNNATSHRLCDTERGATKLLSSNETSGETAVADTLTAFNSDGFTLGADTGNWGINLNSTYSQTSWTFRKAPKFFDVVTYTGNGTAGRTVAHNLGSTPAAIIVKRTDGAGMWRVFHSSLGATKNLYLNDTSAALTQSDIWNDTSPTDSEFTVGDSGNVNGSGQTYVAYLFASDAGGFGDDGSESIIKCGVASYPVSGDVEVNLGFEPQWVLLKDAKHSGQPWWIIDTMRGWSAQKTGGTLSSSTGGNWQALFAESSSAESSYNYGGLTSTGFKLPSNNNYGDGNTDYIYIAIRRPMKTPESGTEVFAIDQWEGATTLPTAKSGFPVDMAIWKDIDGSDGYAADRMRGRVILRTNTTDAETSSSSYGFDYMNGYLDVASNDTTRYSWMFKRATGFFDVVAYTGDGVAGRTVSHNLGVAPEMMIVKSRSNARNWDVYHSSLGATKWIPLNLTNAAITNVQPWNNTEPTADVFTVGVAGDTNSSGYTYVAYLFATVAGVSKVGSYTGTGSNVNVDCGFSAGARFILIKRTDSTGDWYVWDSERGIVAGNDPYLLLNSTAAEVTSTDYIDPLSSGFTVTSAAPAALNASGGTYIFLAIS